MLSVRKSKFVLKLLVPIFVAVLSMFVLSAKIPQTRFVRTSLESVEKSKTTVMEFTGATLAASLALSALPDDFATPLADSLSDMNKYFVFILMVLFVERLILTRGIPAAFAVIIPAGCLLYTAGYAMKREFLVGFGKKIAILGLALVLVIPCSTHLTNYICADYLTYVDETIDDTQKGSDSINSIVSEQESNQSIFEKISDVFQSAIKGVKGLLDYFNNMIKKCINSIAIMIVTTFVLPLANLFFFKWLLAELFRIQLSTPDFLRYRLKKKPSGIEIEDKITTGEE